MTRAPLSVPGAYVSLDDVASWMAEISTRDTPESLLIEREEATEDDDEMAAKDYAVIREISETRLKGYLERIPPAEALALMLHLGLLGYPETYQDQIAEVLGVRSQQLVSYMVRRARARILYLATRPAIDPDVLARSVSPAQLAVIVDVFETASFAEAARKRWTCPVDLEGKAAHAWQRVRSNRIKREFFRALAKIERLAELAAQHAALVHLVENLGTLSHHAGKGSWWRA